MRIHSQSAAKCAPVAEIRPDWTVFGEKLGVSRSHSSAAGSILRP